MKNVVALVIAGAFACSQVQQLHQKCDERLGKCGEHCRHDGESHDTDEKGKPRSRPLHLRPVVDGMSPGERHDPKLEYTWTALKTDPRRKHQIKE